MPRSVLALMLAALFSMGLPVVAHAEESPGSILVIMDVSGSMQREDASGTTLIAGAREAVRGLVSSTPGETPVGLRLYGNTYAGNNKQVGCQDTELSVPIGPLSSTGSAIQNAIEGAQPTGFTPIGYSLKQAAKDFAPEGARTIVLVSDGEDTCNSPAPCKAARQLRTQGIDVRVDTVGLFLQGNAKAREQLECVSKATGGTYYAADDTAALTSQLNAVSQRAIQRFESSGTPVVGGPAATEAATIEAGQPYTDDVALGEARWYSFEADEGQDVIVTVTEDGATEYGCCMELRLYGPDLGSSIGFKNGLDSDGTAQTYRVTSFEDGLRDSGTHYVEVSLDADGEGVVELELQVDVSGAAPVASPSASPSESAAAVASPSASASAEADPEVAASSSDAGGNGLFWALIGLLALAVVVLGAAVVLLFLKLNKQSQTPS